MKIRRCAIYARKSSEEGLDQSFNSLDAQREACEAYVASQKGEGWKSIAATYDDGGWSGGTMARPALRQLLDDVAAGKIDIIIVYKVDRLTRSLSDFARMVELFDKHAVSFVSVTQAFNTTTSMGRLTLNVLLSFAQFEREVTGERIRDKLAASKARGMWMGGYPPLGYDPDGRTLKVNELEAATARHIFSRYLELESVNQLRCELSQAGIRTKRFVSAAGRERGGVEFSNGSLFHMLRNRLYVGEIVHKDRAFPGQHEGIIDPVLFEAVQQKLNSNKRERRQRAAGRSPLTGLIYDASGKRMSPAHTLSRTGRRHRYYVSSSLQTGSPRDPTMLQRVPALLIEQLTLDRLRAWSGKHAASWDDLKKHLIRADVHEHRVILQVSTPDAHAWASNLEPDETIEAQDEGSMTICVRVTLRLRGGRIWLASASGQARTSRPDKALINGLRRAHRELRTRGVDLMGRSTFTHAKGVNDPYLRRLAQLAFLAPDIQRAIVEGRHPPGLTLSSLMDQEVPSTWSEQRKLLGF